MAAQLPWNPSELGERSAGPWLNHSKSWKKYFVFTFYKEVHLLGGSSCFKNLTSKTQDTAVSLFMLGKAGVKGCLLRHELCYLSLHTNPQTTTLPSCDIATLYVYTIKAPVKGSLHILSKTSLISSAVTEVSLRLNNFDFFSFAVLFLKDLFYFLNTLSIIWELHTIYFYYRHYQLLPSPPRWTPLPYPPNLYLLLLIIHQI